MAACGQQRDATQRCCWQRTAGLEQLDEEGLREIVEVLRPPPEGADFARAADQMFRFCSRSGRVHPPAFSIHHRLSDWPGCRIEAHCKLCQGRRVDIPVRLLRMNGPDRSFASVIAGLRCKGCGGKPAPVCLVAGLTRSFCFGPPPSWAVELVPKP